MNAFVVPNESAGREAKLLERHATTHAACRVGGK